MNDRLAQDVVPEVRPRRNLQGVSALIYFERSRMEGFAMR